jgi:hypothetical protein
MSILEISPSGVSDGLIKNLCNKEYPNNKRARIMSECGKIVQDELQDMNAAIRLKGIFTYMYIHISIYIYMHCVDIFTYKYIHIYIHTY